VKESGCGLALLPGGSLDGLTRYADGQAMAAGLHILDAESGDYNGAAVRDSLGQAPVVLIEWAWRRQGLIVAPGNPLGLTGVTDLADPKVRIMRRQPAAGSELLLSALAAEAGITLDDAPQAAAARGEMDLGLAVLEGRADTGLAVEAVARALRLDFVPVTRERFDLLIGRREYFEPPIQSLLEFARGPAFRDRAAAMGGYDLSGLGTVRYNAP
jgi:molybdate-binding protein